MGIRIDEINVEEIGPISKLQLTLGSLNLIYGRNEQGKTFLVEFLIRSLFNNRSGWSLRPSGCRGKVILSGVREKPLGFTPYSKKKLEDYLAENEPGMPPQISHLLVVKGAELGFEDDNRTGINNKVLKNFLSGQGILDVIQGRMSKTVMDARIDGGQIIGHRRGEIKIRSDLARRQNALNQLFKDIDKTYSDGERRTLENDINNLGEKITDQVGAKQYLAYL